MDMHLLPKPRRLSETDGFFRLSPQTCIVLCADSSSVEKNAAKQLQQEIRRFAGVSVPILCGEPRKGDLSFAHTPAIASEAYELAISPASVVISAGDDLGILHGAQTLRQIIRQSGALLPALSIEDAPVYPVRGFYHDVSRGRTPTLEALKRLADEACFYKLNQLQLYVEHTYLFRDLSEMWRVSRPLTAEEILELDDYCAARGIELVPSLSCFGHLFELLHSKSYRALCELPDVADMPSTMPNRMHHHTLNISDPRSFELVKGMLREFMPLFRSRKFNICADETFDLGRGRSRAQMEAEGERSYYIGFVKKLCEFVVEQGRTPMFWGDIVVRFADALKELPQGTICLNWDYSPTVSEDGTRILAEAGATQYVCPGVCGWNQWMNLLRAGYDNISRMAAYGRRYGAVGLLNTDWGDYGHINDPRFSLPGLIYGASFAWSSDAVPFDELNAAVSRIAYLDRSESVVSLLASMQGLDVYPWYALVRHKEWVNDRLDRPEPETPLSVCDPKAVEEANQRLSDILLQLQAHAVDMDSSARGMLEGWLIAGNAIMLWNRAGAAVHQNQKDSALAGELENWFCLYERLWRENCHESELWRIRDVVWWYADQLR